MKEIQLSITFSCSYVFYRPQLELYPSLKVLKLAKSSFRKLYDVNRESAKILAAGFFAKSSFRKIFIAKQRIYRNFAEDL